VQTPDDARPSLLFVDDEPRVLNSIRAVFKSGYDLTISSSGLDALALLRKRPFDVIVCDQRMPGMTGVEFFRRARKLTPGSVRILLSGYTDTDALLSAVNDVEVHRFLKKPWDNAMLRKVVAQAVDIRRAMRAQGPAALPAEPALPRQAKQGLLVVDPRQRLYPQVHAEFSGRYQVVSCRSLVACLDLLRTGGFPVLVCALDVRNDSDLVFLMALKQEHPEVMVITLCEESDGRYLSELINRVGIFRFLREPGSFQLLTNYLHSAFERVRRQR